jgi:hypothetical protein
MPFLLICQASQKRYNQSSLLSNTYSIKTLTVFLHPMKGISYLRA